MPIILGISWVACRWLIARFDVPPQLNFRLAMGGLAFAILMIAELGVSVFGFGRTSSVYLVHYRTWPALLGLAGQIAFAVFSLALSATTRDKSD